eukprot:4413940-Amphidinium_carterae.1
MSSSLTHAPWVLGLVTVGDSAPIVLDALVCTESKTMTLGQDPIADDSDFPFPFHDLVCLDGGDRPPTRFQKELEASVRAVGGLRSAKASLQKLPIVARVGLRGEVGGALSDEHVEVCRGELAAALKVSTANDTEDQVTKWLTSGAPMGITSHPKTC